MPEYNHMSWVGLENMQCATNFFDQAPPEIILQGISNTNKRMFIKNFEILVGYCLDFQNITG